MGPRIVQHAIYAILNTPQLKNLPAPENIAILLGFGGFCRRVPFRRTGSLFGIDKHRFEAEKT
jgi:hypothetical protein